MEVLNLRKENDIKRFKQLNGNICFINIAKEIAKMSKCISFQVGALVVKDKRIISSGYNGTPVGFLNCDEKFEDNKPANFREEHHSFSEKFEIHAEMNAVIFAARNGISIEGSDVYLTLHPCNQCLKNLCNCGIKNIFYVNEYDKFDEDPEIDTMLKICKVNLVKIVL